MSNMVGEAFVRVRPDTKAFAGEAKRGISSGLKSALAVGGVTVGVAAAVQQIRGAVKAAKEAQTIQFQTAAVLRTAGLSWEQYGSQIEEAANKQAKLQAFDDEEVSEGFTRIFRNVRDVGRALELTALAGDLATSRMKNGQRDLAGAALIVGKVAGGNVGILKRYGITLKEGATASEALAALQDKVAGSAEAFASGAEGSQAKLNKVFGDTQEIVGGALLPTITDLTTRLGAYIENANESGETQRRVNEAMEVTGEVVRGVAEGIDLIRTVTGPAIAAVGGVENAVKILVAAFAVSKVLKFAGAVRGVAASFGFIAASSRATTAKVVADAAVASAALDAAYRPRSVIVLPGGTPTGTGGPILGPNGKPLPSSTPKPKPSRATRLGRFVRRVPGVGGLAAGLLGSKALGALAAVGLTAATVATIEAVAILSSKGDSATGGDENDFPFVMRMVGKVQAGERLTKREIAAVKTLGNKSVANLSVADLRALNNKLAAASSADRNVQPGRRPEEGTAARDARRGAAADRPERKPPPRTGPRRLSFKQVEGRIAGFDEQITDAQIAGSVSGERKALAAEKRFLEEQLQDTKRSAEQRRRLKDELLRVTSAIAGIDDTAAAARKGVSDKATAKAKEREQAAEKRKTAEERANAAELKASAKLFDKELRGAGISTAAQITAKIRGQDASKLGVFSTGSGPSASSSGSRGVTGSANTITIDQLLRDIAQGQAQRDSLQLAQATETNRLLRIIAPGDQRVPASRRGRTPGSGPQTARETADVTGGLP